MRVERSSLEQVKKRFEVNKKKIEEKKKDYDIEQRMKELREEEEKLKEYRKEKRKERLQILKSDYYLRHISLFSCRHKTTRLLPDGLSWNVVFDD